MLLVPLVLLGVLSSCALFGGYQMPGPDEVQAFIDARPNLSRIDLECLENHTFKMSMTEETALFLLGEPKEVIIDKKPWGSQKQCFYKGRLGFEVLTFDDGKLVAIQ